MRSPAVTSANFPGIDCALVGPYRSTLPKRTMLLRFLNLSPPCAARAARASSRGVLVAVIAGAALIVLVELVGVGFAAFGPWAITAVLSKNVRTASVDALLFMADSFRL